MQWIFWYDWALMPVYFLLLVTIVFRFGKKRYSGSKLKYFKYGFIVKLIGALGFGVYHQYIYRGGDTLLYFDTGIKLADFASTDFHRYISLVFSPTASTINLQFDTLDDIVYGEPNFFVVRVTAVLAFFCFKSYIPILLMFSSLSYIGIWYAYTSICKLYSHLTKELAIIFLFIPSVVLWGSGLGKDSLTLGGTCLVFGALVKLFLVPKPKRIKNILYLAVGSFTVLIIKPYIIYSFILCFTIGILLQRIILIKNKAAKLIIGPLLICIGMIATIGAFNYVSTDPDFGLDLIANRVLKNNKNLGESSGAGSAYDLGMNLDRVNGFADILPIFPKSVFVTLFRPFLWEVSNSAMLLSALESFLFLIFFTYILLKRKIFGIFSALIRHPIAISCLLYTVIFAGLVGISSGNFGTLVRYKIPCLPFFGLALVLLNEKGKTSLKVSDKLLNTDPLLS
jgi:hypothetical protein